MIRVAAIYCCLFFFCGVALGEKPQEWNSGIIEKHINALKNDVVDLESYIISAALPETSRVKLEARLNRSRLQSFSGDFELKVAESKVLGDLAMSIIVVKTHTNPLFAEAVAIAFCRVDGIWKAAPVLGVYSMTGFGGYQPSMIKSRESLEAWGRQRSKFYRDLRLDELGKVFKKQLKSHHAANSPLRDGSKKQAILYFMSMCRDRNFSGVLACIAPQGDEIAEYETVHQGFKRKKSTWSRLLTKNYCYGVLPDIDDSEVLSIGCYFPSEKLKNQIFEFNMDREDGYWRVYLPSCMELNSDGSMDDDSFKSYKLETENRDRLPRVFSSLMSETNHQERVSAQTHRSNLMKAIEEEDFQAFINMIGKRYSIEREGEELTDAELNKRQKSCTQLWSKIHNSKVEELAEFSTDEYLFQYLLVYSDLRPGNAKVVPVLSVNGLNGWRVIPEYKFSSNAANWLISTKELESCLAREVELRSEIQDRWLEGVVGLSSVKMLPIEDQSGVEIFYNKYQAHLLKGDIATASHLVACDDTSRAELLKAIGSDVRGLQSSSSTYTFCEVLLSDRVALIVVELSYQDKSTREYLAYPLINIEKYGRRLLPSYLYYFEHGRGQVALNKEMIKGVKSGANDEFQQEFTDLIDSFNIRIKEKLDEDSK